MYVYTNVCFRIPNFVEAETGNNIFFILYLPASFPNSFPHSLCIIQHCASNSATGPTVNFLNIRTPKKFVVINLKFELCGSTIE